eukprot:1148859-Pelagomonas_calceolata.AAC.5
MKAARCYEAIAGTSCATVEHAAMQATDDTHFGNFDDHRAVLPLETSHLNGLQACVLKESSLTP